MGTSQLRVLVVEDEALVAMLIEDMLVELGHEVVGPAACIEEALELVQTAAPDVAVLDVNLNGRDAYPIAAALAARAIPFIFASGHGAASLPAPYRDCATVQKPYRAEDLEAALAKALAARSRER